MSGPRISDLTEITELAANDLLVVVDTSANQTKKIQFSNLNPSEKETTVTADYTITKDNEMVFASGDVTITLPAASNAWKASIANIGTGVVTIACASGDVILLRGGMTTDTYTLGNRGEAVTLRSNGGALWVEF